MEKGGVRDGGLVCDYVASRKFQHAGAAVDVVYEVAVEEGGMRDGLPRGQLELLVAHSHIAVILTAQPYWASIHLCSLKLRYRTIPPAELNLQYWLITDTLTTQQKTGTVRSFFIWTVSPKMVLLTSWWCSEVGQEVGFSRK